MDWTSIAATKRIVAREQGAIVKDWGGKLPLALVYPNSYRVGMSSLALHNLYREMNSQTDIVCERAFCGYQRVEPAAEPLSLETQHRLADFGMLAVTFSFELDYLNFVVLLHAAGIPPLSCLRDDRDPFIVAGGPAVSANPEPLADVCDAFFIGEVEEMLHRLLDTVRQGLLGDRSEFLRDLSCVPGVYVPAPSDNRNEGPADLRHASNSFVAQTPDRVERQWVRELDRYASSTTVFTRATEFGDLHLLEIARGCGRGCRFCLAGCIYRPPRERSAPALLEQARLGRKFRSKAGLISAAVSDYSQIDPLLDGLERLRMGISVSSLRVDPLPERLLRAIVASGTRTLTFAPEAGSERLRHSVHKQMTQNDIMNAADQASRFGFTELKLYFMIGLPGEEADDVEAIGDLVRAIQQVFRGRVSASVAPFVPKAHTPFQRVPMASAAVLQQRLRRLRGLLQNLGVRMTCESVAWSRVQAALARGDRTLGLALASLKNVSLSSWTHALEAHQLSQESYLAGRSGAEALPWSFIKLYGSRQAHESQKPAREQTL